MTTKNHVTVALTDELDVEQALMNAGIENPKSVAKLTITGKFTFEDQQYIYEKMNTSLDLDIGKADFKFSELNLEFINFCDDMTITVPGWVLKRFYLRSMGVKC